jgi:hypothetical protein
MGPHDIFDEFKNEINNLKDNQAIIDYGIKKNQEDFTKADSLGYLPAYITKTFNQEKYDLLVINESEFVQKWRADELDLPKLRHGEEIKTPIVETDNIGEVLTKKPKRISDALNDFLFSNNIKYQDPTYLGYEILLITDESPLFNYDRDINTLTRQSAQSFISKYGDLPDINNRAELLSEFQEQLKEIFLASTDINLTKLSRRHYVEMITGLDKLNEKIVKYGEDLIEITLTEDVSLRTQYLIELYNNLIYDYKNKRNIIPENLLRFNMIIKIEDIRDFKINNKIINNRDSGTFLVYKLNDCNFDFSASQSHEDSINLAGFNPFSQSNMNNAKFTIKYKSIEKIYESSLINETSIQLNNQKIESLVSDFDNSIYFQVNKKDLSKPRNYITQKKTPRKRQHKQNAYLNIIKDNAKEAAAGLKNKFNEIRGGLLTDIIEEVHDLTTLPDKLGNVYSTDFRQLSIQNFATGLANDLFDKAKNDVTGIIMNVTDPFKGKKHDDSKLGSIDDI